MSERPYGPRTSSSAWLSRRATQLKWLRTRMEQAAPQALVVAA